MNLFPVRINRRSNSPLSSQLDFPLFQNRLAQMFGWPDKEDLLAPGNTWSPSLDVTETDKEMVIKVEVPGMEKKDVNVEIDNGDIVIKGERKVEKEEKKDHFVHIERSYGTFFRRLVLPDYADKDSIKATCKNGLLELKLDLLPDIKKDVKRVAID